MKTVKFISIAMAGVLLLLSACKKDNGNEPKKTEKPGEETVTDICGNTYPVVKIGEQYWMAENLRCDKYDTKSEAYNAYWLTNNTIPTSKDIIFTPYYTDASDKSKWDSDSKTKYGVNLTDVQVKKLGYLYNWAAAVGGEGDDGKHVGPFQYNHQGICPNGWHIPSPTEMEELIRQIEINDKYGNGFAGKHLKTKEGWSKGWGEELKLSSDTYGFSLLPSGVADGDVLSSVGAMTYLWTSEDEVEGWDAKYYSVHGFLDEFHMYGSHYGGNKSEAFSVRCIKD